MSSSALAILIVVTLAVLGLVYWIFARYRAEVLRKQHQLDLERLHRTLNDAVRENRDRMALLARQSDELQRATRALHQTRREVAELQPLKEQIDRLKGHIAVLQAEIEHHRQMVEALRSSDEFADTLVDDDDEELVQHEAVGVAA